jgi:hypothetical protein
MCYLVYPSALPLMTFKMQHRGVNIKLNSSIGKARALIAGSDFREEGLLGLVLPYCIWLNCSKKYIKHQDSPEEAALIASTNPNYNII